VSGERKGVRGEKRCQGREKVSGTFLVDWVDCKEEFRWGQTLFSVFTTVSTMLWQRIFCLGKSYLNTSGLIVVARSKASGSSPGEEKVSGTVLVDSL
jgi:hypothetical protein